MPVTPLIRADRLIIITARLWDRAGGAGDVKLALDTRLWALGFEVQNEIVHAHALPDQYDIDGLLGLRFLDRLDYTIRSRRNEVEARLATA